MLCARKERSERYAVLIIACSGKAALFAASVDRLLRYEARAGEVFACAASFYLDVKFLFYELAHPPVLGPTVSS